MNHYWTWLFCPGYRFTAALLNSAHDAYDIYRLFEKYGIEPFIDLNQRNKSNTLYPKADFYTKTWKIARLESSARLLHTDG